MMKSMVLGLVSLGIAIAPGMFALARSQDASFSGVVERVWEDGFQLSTKERSIAVDSYDVCGDKAARHVVAGERVTVTGEFEEGEFDAFSIIKADGTTACR